MRDDYASVGKILTAAAADQRTHERGHDKSKGGARLWTT